MISIIEVLYYVIKASKKHYRYKIISVFLVPLFNMLHSLYNSGRLFCAQNTIPSSLSP